MIIITTKADMGLFIIVIVVTVIKNIIAGRLRRYYQQFTIIVIAKRI